jgi:hypothetical protein
MRPQVPIHPDEDRLLELAYGEMPAAEARTLRKHVDGCTRCRSVLDGIAEVRSAFRSVPAEPAPERGLESLLAYGEQAAARARSRRGGLRILGILSAAAVLAVALLLVPATRDSMNVVVASRVRAPADSSAVARLDRPVAPAQGDSARAEEKAAVEAPEGATAQYRARAPASPPLKWPVAAKKETPREDEAAATSGLKAKQNAPSASAVAELSAPDRRASEPEPARDARQKDLAKQDSMAERKAAVDAEDQLRRLAPSDRGVASGSASAQVAATRPNAGGSTVGGAIAGVDATAKKSVAPAGADDKNLAAAPPMARALRAEEAAKVVAAPMSEGFASESARVTGVTTPPKPMAKSTPAASAGKAAAATPAPGAVDAQAKNTVQSGPVRTQLGTAEQQSRLAEVKKKLETATGNDRKALLMEQCELEAAMMRGPDAVVSCSAVTREFPGTPEAARASKIAQGFSLQLPIEAPER